MSYKIQSEYQYYLEVTQELEGKLVSKLYEFISACASISTNDVNNLPPNENEMIANLYEKFHQLSGRVSKAISKTEEEVVEEWNAIHHLLEGDGQNNNSNTNTTNTTFSPTSKNKKVAERALSELPAKLIELTELKYLLLQCETCIK